MSLRDVLPKLEHVRKSGGNYAASCPGPAHERGDRNPSLSVGEGEDGRVLLKCHVGCSPDAIVDSLGLAMADLFPERENDGKPQIAGTYDYADADGTVLFQVVRFRPKDFRQRRPDGRGGWIWKLDGVQRVPYRLPKVLAGVKGDRWVFIVEGEKDADSLVRAGFVATTNAGGAGKWKPEYARFFKGAKVAIIPDNDEPGRDHAEQVAKALSGVANTVRVVELPGLDERSDVSDWLAGGGTAEQLKDLVRKAPEREPDPASRNSGTDQRAPAMEGDSEGKATSADFAPVWSLSETLTKSEECFLRYMDFGERSHSYSTVLALWCLHTWAIGAATATPYLNIDSPVKRCGKSRVLDVLALLVREAWRVIEPSPAALFRFISMTQPTLLLDEVDAVFGGKSDSHETLRAVLNAGYERGAQVPRCVNHGAQVVMFDTFCPKALAGIAGKVPDTVADRSIPIRLQRKRKGIAVEKFRKRDAEEAAEPIRNHLGHWAAELGEALRHERPRMPDALDDRAADVCEPLLAIADAAGGNWPERARSALVEIMESKTDAESTGGLLLSELRRHFEGTGKDRVSTEELLRWLIDHGEGPWAEWWGQKVESGESGVKAAGQRLGKLLKPYGITSTKVRLGVDTARGYLRDNFEDAWARYLNHPTEDRACSGYKRRCSDLNNGTTEHCRSECISDGARGDTYVAPEQECSIVPLLTTEQRETGSERDADGLWISAPRGSLCDLCGRRTSVATPDGIPRHKPCHESARGKS